MTIRWNSSIPAFLSAAGPLALYLGTLAPEVGTIDSGELAAVCAHLGIAHPTGYPLYTLLGRLAHLLLAWGSPIQRLGLLSALLAAFSCLGAYLLFREIAGSVRRTLPVGVRDGIALGGAWVWAVHPAFWAQAIGNEVHALQALLATLLLWFAIRPHRIRLRLLALYLLGLGLTNHMTILYLVPGLAAGALLAGEHRSLLCSRRTGLASIGAFLAPLTLVLFLPIRSHCQPLLDWGDPETPARLLRHLAGAQYRIWLFASADGFAGNLERFLRELVAPITAPALAAAAAGAWALARSDRAMLARLGLGFLVATVWASGYEIHDLDPYYLIPRLCLAAMAIAGVSLLPWRRGTPLARAAAIGIVILLGPALAAVRLPAADRSEDRFVRLYAEETLDRLPPRAILLTRHWDMVYSPLLYLRHVEGLRPDVSVVDTELLRRSWYFPQLRRADPELFEGIEGPVARLLEQLRLFESGRPYDPASIEGSYRAVIAALFTAHRDDRPIFYTPEVEPSFHAGWYGIPEALAVRIVRDPAAAPPAAPLEADRWEEPLRFAGEPVRRNAWGFAIELARGRIRFLEETGRLEEAERWRRALVDLAALPVGGTR